MSLNTLDEAKAAGATHVNFLCESCRRSSSLMIDVVRRKTRHRTVDEVAGAFTCKLCGRKPGRVMFTAPDSKLHYFNYVVVVWGTDRLAVDHVEAATMELEDIEPAFQSVSQRFPKRWVTLQSRSALLQDSDDREFVFDG